MIGVGLKIHIIAFFQGIRQVKLFFRTTVAYCPSCSRVQGQSGFCPGKTPGSEPNYTKTIESGDSQSGGRLVSPQNHWSRRSDLNRHPADYDLLLTLGAYFEHSQWGEGDFKDRHQVSENSMGPLEVTIERRGALVRLLICVSETIE